ncbi:MAG: methyltransferase, FxLD system [Pseudonocardiales bacterium]
MDTDTAHTQSLRTELVDQLVVGDSILTPAVEAAMRAVPRHLFLPGVPVGDCYLNQHVVTKRDTEGTPLSSASQPSTVAMMLEQLDVELGHRVLEIGAGTGYNAALLRELAGPRGAVTTIDIDPEAVEDARTGLAATGYVDVAVVAGDGALGAKTRAPYDRIIVTAAAWDLPPAWWEQLAEGGRIVVPLRWRGQTRSIAFDHQPGHLISRSVKLCGFIPLRSPGSEGERVVALDDRAEVTLYYDEDQCIDPDTLHGVLDQPKSQSWSGVTVGSYDPFDGVWLRLSTAEPGACRIAAQPCAVDNGLATPAIPTRSPAVIEGTSLAYFALRPHTGTQTSGGRRFELGAIGHGNGDLAHRITEQIRTWDRDRTAQPVITAYPAGTPDDQLPAGVVIDKQHTRLTLAW